MLNDIRYAIRSLSKNPLYTISVIVILGFGIGANTAMFSLMHQTLVARLPGAETSRLIQVLSQRESDKNANLSYPVFAALRDRGTMFDGVLGHTPQALSLGTDAGTIRIQGALVSGGFFSTLNVKLQAGRDFVEDEGEPGSAIPVVVLSHALWTSRFDADPDIIGSTITLNDNKFTIVGIAPSAFVGLVRGERFDAWVPFGMLAQVSGLGPYVARPTVSWMDVFGRLREGVSLETAQADLRVLDEQLIQEAIRSPNEYSLLQNGNRGLTWLVSDFKSPLRILGVVVVLVLLIGCANVSHLLLARGWARRRELAVRVSLGASRFRLARQLFTESVLLAVAGGALGLIMASWTMQLLLTYRPSIGGVLQLDSSLNTSVLIAALTISLLTSVLFGLMPAIRAARVEPIRGLRGEVTAGRLGGSGRAVLLVPQVALSLILLVAAGLFLQTLMRLRALDPGYSPDGVLLASVDLEPRGYDDARTTAFYQQLLDRLRLSPGVEQVSLAQTITPNPSGSNWGGVQIAGYTPPAEAVVSFDVNTIGPDYFETMKIPLLQGRGFNDTDIAGTPPVMVINETMAGKYWAGRNPIGGLVNLSEDSTGPMAEVIGVARDGKYRGLRAADETNAYFPVLQQPSLRMTIIARTTGNPAGLAAAVRQEVSALDPALPVFGVRTLREHVNDGMAQERLLATLVTLFSVVALILVALGLFSTIAYTVVQRTREIGIRIALGAAQGNVFRVVMAHALSFTVLGLALGLVGTWVLTRFARSMLFGVSPGDPTSLVGGMLVLLAVAMLAAYLPARRATKVDPLVALRSE